MLGVAGCVYNSCCVELAAEFEKREDTLPLVARDQPVAPGIVLLGGYSFSRNDAEKDNESTHTRVMVQDTYLHRSWCLVTCVTAGGLFEPFIFHCVSQS